MTSGQYPPKIGEMPSMITYALPVAPESAPRKGAPAFRYSLSAFILFTSMIGVAFVSGFQLGKYHGFDLGYRQGRWETPEFDETHPKIGPLLKARPRNPRD